MVVDADILRHFAMPDLVRPIIEAEYSGVREALQHGKTREAIIEIAERAITLTEASLQRVTELVQSDTPLACRAGCSYCCRHLVVGTSAPEVFIIALYLTSPHAAVPLPVIWQRLEEHVSKTRGVVNRDRGGVRMECPFLIEHQCSIYPVRPLLCRGYNSYSIEECREHHDRYPEETKVSKCVPYFELPKAVDTGMRMALVELGLGGAAPLELVAAVRIALRTPENMDRWLAGEPIFKVAELSLVA
jgi:Fe-S-cluster containining protein